MAIHYFLKSALLVVALGVAACAQPDAAPAAPTVTNIGGVHRELVTVQTTQGPLNFQAEIADDEAERSRGLMFRREMARDHGMLFLFDAPEPQSFWMRNTHLSLDLIFVGPDGRILNIAERATPYSDAAIRSAGPAVAVLEINGGLSRELGIAVGDRVTHPRINAG